MIPGDATPAPRFTRESAARAPRLQVLVIVQNRLETDF
jgi:hypothetical protein